MQVKKKVCRVAAKLLEADPADIRWEDQHVWVVGAPEKSVRLGDLAQAAASGREPLILPEGPGLEATSYFSPPSITYASGVHAAVARVNLNSGQVALLRYIVAHDCGRLLNPKIVEGQIIGGVIQGIGGALFEELVYDGQGQLLTASFADYPMPRAKHIPAIEVHHIETPSTVNPLGARGAGEGGTVPAYAAVAGAVEDALSPFNIQIDRVPIPPRLIYEMMQGRHTRTKPGTR
jgi:aerobic carbon-monoxide dehydrogenase large subunit